MRVTFNESLYLGFAITLVFIEIKGFVLTPAFVDFLSFDRLNHDEGIFSKEYDFIVIGGGTAGSVLANRLTENPKFRLLVLENGREETFLTDVPLFAPILHVTDYVKIYKSEPRDSGVKNGGHCLAMTNNSCNFITGNAIGGSSVINFMIYSRGTPQDYDEWEAYGNPGWSYKDVFRYFVKSENCKLNDADFRYHGHGGYLDVTYPPYVSPLRECFLNASVELGYDKIDYNADKFIGFSILQSTLRNGRRMSASKAFLRPIKGRPNFHLSQNSKATRILIDPKTKTALGVEFIKNGKRYLIKASKEVILSAGTINSAKLLMLSGVGPKDHLNSVGIRPIEDLPVGYNFFDHLCLPVINFLVNETVTLSGPKPIINVTSAYDYLKKGTGPFTLPGGTEGVAFLATNEDNKNVPDVELILSLSSLVGDTANGFAKLVGYSDDFVKSIFSKYEGTSAFSIVPIISKPKSRGRITLRSIDPFADPIIEPNYYDHSDDLKTMIRAIKKAIELGSTKSFERYNTTLVPLLFPGCKHTVYMSDQYWACVARYASATLGHYGGTCKMSPKEKSGVVDHRLRVHGIKSLRVIDNSVMPSIISGHTSSTAYMIAEKGSDMIKEDWAFVK